MKRELKCSFSFRTVSGASVCDTSGQTCPCNRQLSHAALVGTDACRRDNTNMSKVYVQMSLQPITLLQAFPALSQSWRQKYSWSSWSPDNVALVGPVWENGLTKTFHAMTAEMPTLRWIDFLNVLLCKIGFKSIRFKAGDYQHLLRIEASSHLYWCLLTVD